MTHKSRQSLPTFVIDIVGTENPTSTISTFQVSNIDEILANLNEAATPTWSSLAYWSIPHIMTT